MRIRTRALIVSALVVGLAAAGCSKNSGSSTDTGGPQKQDASPLVIDFKGTTPTPAPAVAGAKQGGSMSFLEDGMMEHLAPAQIYVSDALDISTNLFHRMLTTYIEPSTPGGQMKVVGDLATNAGETTDGGKTWTYHLRNNIKFEDGSPITAQDIAYGISVSFSDFGVQGPQYIQQALNEGQATAYKGPYTDGSLAPGITTPDAKTIVFTLKNAHPEWPYLVAFPTSTPIQKAKDTKANYDFDWQSTGPYKRKELKKDQYLILERNPNWDPNSDPVRHQYLDTIKLDFTADATTQTNRVSAGTGDDATAIMNSAVSPELIAQVSSDPTLMKRAMVGPTPFMTYVNINTQRVTDLAVRQALNYAFDKAAYIKAAGGDKVFTAAGSVEAPIVPGWKNYDAYPMNVDKAKSLIAGKTVPKLQYCFANTQLGQTLAAVIKQSLESAGFQIALNPIDRAAYYTTIGKKDTTCDLMRSGWGQDFPDGLSTMSVLLDGTKIVPSGNQNYSYFNEPSVNDKLHQLDAMTDRGAANTGYAALDQEIMTKYAPLIPVAVQKAFQLYGPKVGGVFLSPLYDEPNMTNAYVLS